jgi:hypothetical protein
VLFDNAKNVHNRITFPRSSIARQREVRSTNIMTSKPTHRLDSEQKPRGQRRTNNQYPPSVTKLMVSVVAYETTETVALCSFKSRFRRYWPRHSKPIKGCGCTNLPLSFLDIKKQSTHEGSLIGQASKQPTLLSTDPTKASHRSID